jgi:hypothetical protein
MEALLKYVHRQGIVLYCKHKSCSTKNSIKSVLNQSSKLITVRVRNQLFIFVT